jgi:hypothetical protein
MLIFAMRYALARRTAASLMVVMVIKKMWDQISLATRVQIKREILEAEDRENDWEEVLEL